MVRRSPSWIRFCDDPLRMQSRQPPSFRERCGKPRRSRFLLTRKAEKTMQRAPGSPAGSGFAKVEASTACFCVLTSAKKADIIFLDMKSDEAERVRSQPAPKRAGESASPVRWGTGSPPRSPRRGVGRSPALWAREGAARRQPEWYRECVCSSPDGRRIFIWKNAARQPRRGERKGEKR